MENQNINENSKNKYLPKVVLLSVALVGVSAYFLMRSSSVGDQVGEKDILSEPQATATAVPVVDTSSTPVSSASPNLIVSTVKTFIVFGSNFSFSPAEIKVKKGDTVKIAFQNIGGTHNWVIDEFNVKTSTIQGGKQEEVEFVADKIGTFEYYCSIGSHRAMGMRGNLIVE